MVEGEQPDGTYPELRALINSVDVIDILDKPIGPVWRRVDPELRHYLMTHIHSQRGPIIPEDVLEGFNKKDEMGLRVQALMLALYEPDTYQGFPKKPDLVFSAHELVDQNGESKYIIALSRHDDLSHKRYLELMPRLVDVANRGMSFFTNEPIPPYPQNL